MLLQGHKPKLDEVSEKFVVLTSDSSEHLDALGGKFERGLLKLETLSWGIWKEETIINVHDVAFVVNHNILIVSIFDL